MRPTSKFNSQSGYSMVELMVALGITLVISAASFALFSGSMKFTNSTYHMTDAEEALRNAHEVMNRDLTTAGDGLRGIGTITAPVGFVQTFLTRTPVTCNDPNYPCIGVVTSDDSIPAGTAVPLASTAVNFQPNSDRISMLTVDTNFNTGNAVSLLAGKITISGTSTLLNVGTANIGLFQVNEIYAVVSQNSAAFGVVTAVNTVTGVVTLNNTDGGFGLNQTSATAPISVLSTVISGVSTQPASIMRIQIIQYFVDANGLLVRRVYGVRGASFIDSVVAEHITNLQFRYMTNLLDANGNVQQPKRVIATSTEQSGLRQIETSIGVETAKAINAATNVNSSSNACGASPNGKQSICSTTATTVRNLQFRQALAP
ncbi:MAG TPA: prepilin-type N-terminal cleavage/methylation domain-containing protein [Pyrinomonadaceae bacterium]|nr:prepilin-type N-terminal cleavage/methylation domain-containing protein [Pyrinomonadaceae bacterium]